MEEKEKSTNNRVFLILAIILLVLSGVLGWQLFEQKTENDRKTEVIKQINTEKDNLTAELDELLENYKDLEEENGKLTNELEAQRQEILALKADVEKYKGDQSKLNWLKGQLDMYKTKYASLEAKYDSLSAVTQVLVADKAALQTSLTQEQGKNQELTQENVNLSSTVARGSMLTAYRISIEGVRGEKEKVMTKGSRSEKLRICFILGENAITKPGNKNIYMRIIDPEGKVVNNGRDEEFEFEGGRMVFTLVKEVNYQNKQMDICVFQNAPSSKGFKAGKYTVEIYTDKVLIGSANISLR